MKRIESLVVIVCIMFLVYQSSAQDQRDLYPEKEKNLGFSDLMRYSSSSSFKMNIDKSFNQIGEELEQSSAKSPLTAALYSAALPGAGQFYNEEYWSAASFLAAEVGLWVVYGIHESKGDKKTREFEGFGDQYWSVVRYAEWIERYGTTLNPLATILQGTVTSQDPTKPDWDRVDWGKLNRNEEAVGMKSSTGFSHRLPRRPEQQYYEVIGKYEQYSSGWRDANVDPSNYLTNISEKFRLYRDMRGKANSFYYIASMSASLLVANHVFSALHAAWRAAQLNPQVDLEARLVPVNRSFDFVEFVPTARLSIRF